MIIQWLMLIINLNINFFFQEFSRRGEGIVFCQNFNGLWSINGNFTLCLPTVTLVTILRLTRTNGWTVRIWSFLLIVPIGVCSPNLLQVAVRTHPNRPPCSWLSQHAFVPMLTTNYKCQQQSASSNKQLKFGVFLRMSGVQLAIILCFIPALSDSWCWYRLLLLFMLVAVWFFRCMAAAFLLPCCHCFHPWELILKSLLLLKNWCKNYVKQSLISIKW